MLHVHAQVGLWRFKNLSLLQQSGKVLSGCQSQGQGWGNPRLVKTLDNIRQQAEDLKSRQQAGWGCCMILWSFLNQKSLSKTNFYSQIFIQSYISSLKSFLTLLNKQNQSNSLYASNFIVYPECFREQNSEFWSWWELCNQVDLLDDMGGSPQICTEGHLSVKKL